MPSAAPFVSGAGATTGATCRTRRGGNGIRAGSACTTWSRRSPRSDRTRRRDISPYTSSTSQPPCSGRPRIGARKTSELMRCANSSAANARPQQTREKLWGMGEVPLSGGRITEGVVRVAETVRRPPQPNSELVRALLERLTDLDLEIAPRYLGVDEQNREIFSHLAGEVPDDLDAGFDDATLVAAARLIRR